MELLNIGEGRALIITVGKITLAILMLVGSADASILTVNASGGADYTKIQDAINNASKGDTIFVRSGIYKEDIRITRANITIRGEDMNSTFIFGSPSELASQNFVVDISTNNVIFSGFTIDRQRDTWGGTFKAYVYINGHSNTLNGIRIEGDIIIQYLGGNSIVNNDAQTIFIDESNDNRITDNRADEMRLQLSHNNTFVGCRVGTVETFDTNATNFSGNKFDSLRLGYSHENALYGNEVLTLYLDDSGNITIRNNRLLTLSLAGSEKNVISGNEFRMEYGDDPGIRMETSNHNIICENTIISNSWKYSSVTLTNSSNNTILHNDLTGGRNGVLIQSGSNLNTVSDNLIQSAYRYGIFVARSIGNSFNRNTLNNAKNAADYGVSDSWNNNYWSDHADNDLNKDGIMDRPYRMIETNSGALDARPLVSPPCNCSLLEPSVPPRISPKGSHDLLFADSGVDLTCVWNTMNFNGFYNDDKNNTGSEALRVNMNGFFTRRLDAHDLLYITSPKNVSFVEQDFGEYYAIGFIGERYFAGYANWNLTDSPENLLKRGILHTILKDDDSSRRLLTGGELKLDEGYSLFIKNADTVRETDLFSLRKDGTEIDTTSVIKSGNYIFKAQGSDLPIIIVHLVSVDKDVAGIKGIFQISEKPVPVKTGAVYGIMEIAEVSENGISMTNREDLELARNSSIGVMGALKLKVADLDIVDLSLSKDSQDGADCWFDLDASLYSETLKITSINGTTIPEGGMKYTSIGTRVPFLMTKIMAERPDGNNGSYVSIAFGGDRYAAVGGNSSRIARVLIEPVTTYMGKRTLVEGEIWDMGDGYGLQIFTDARSSPRRGRLILSRNGIQLQDKWVTDQDTFTYMEKDPAGRRDIPVFVTYLDAVFAGSTIDMIQLRYTWLMSGNVTEIRAGDRFDDFRVTKAERDFIELENEKPIELIPGSSVHIIGNMSYAVSNSSELIYTEGSADSHAAESNIDGVNTYNKSETGREKVSGFEIISAIAALFLVLVQKMRKKDKHEKR